MKLVLSGGAVSLSKKVLGCFCALRATFGGWYMFPKVGASSGRGNSMACVLRVSCSAGTGQPRTKKKEKIASERRGVRGWRGRGGIWKQKHRKNNRKGKLRDQA